MSGGGASALQLTNMDSILISGSLGRLCKAVQRQSGETGGRAGEEGGAAVPCVLSAATLCCTQSECRRGNGSWKLEPEGVRCGGVAGKVEGCTL